jgi:hypothetical protein
MISQRDAEVGCWPYRRPLESLVGCLHRHPGPPAAEQPATGPSNPADSRFIHEMQRRVGAAAPSKSSQSGLVVVLMRLGLLDNVLNTLRLAAAQPGTLQ